jgi:hypothetical protein
MAIFDIFSKSFLFSTAIILLICGGIFIYFSYKIDKQNHKLTSMVNLVSILAEDLQFVKNQLNKNVENNLQYSSQIQMMNNKVNTDLISVSDGGDINDDDDDDDDDIDIDDDDDDDDNVDVDVDVDVDIDETEKYSVHELTNDMLTNNTLTNDTLINNTLTNEPPLTLFNEIKTIHLENPISFEEPNISLPNHNDLKITSNDINFFKNIPLTDLGDAEDLQGYKEMTINKLREVIVSKGLVLDASKLKKNEILKMLGFE